MNSGLIGFETLRLQLRARVLAVFFPLGFIQQVVGFFAQPVIVQRPVAQFGWEGLLGRNSLLVIDFFKGRLSTIEQIEAELEGARG